jgi:hypothetical protein
MLLACAIISLANLLLVLGAIEPKMVAIFNESLIE